MENDKKDNQNLKDILFSIAVFCLTFAVNLLIQRLFTTQTLIPMIFVFGVFLISLRTHGYCYGIAAAIVSVFAVNFAFTYPYYKLDFFVEESIFSAIIMLVVAVSTSTLNIRIRDQETLRIREQEKLKADSEKERMRGNLLRAISHDLRTPLTSIYGATSTLIAANDSLPNDMKKKLLGEIQEDSEWLIRMVENLLSVTRIDDRKVEIVKTPIVLDELIDSVLMKFEKKHPSQRVETNIPDEFIDMVIDYDKRQVTIKGNEIDLTQTEYNIVAYLSEHAGKVLTYASIIQAIWGYSDYGSTKKLQVNMKNIRKKMGVTPGERRYIINELGVGYRMMEE